MPGNRLLQMSESDQYDGWPVPSSETLTNVPIEAVRASVLLLLPTDFFSSALPPAAYLLVVKTSTISQRLGFADWSAQLHVINAGRNSFDRRISDF